MRLIAFTLLSFFVATSSTSRAGTVFELPSSIKLSEPVTALLETSQRFQDAQWRIIFFGYTHCSDVCPMSVMKMDRVIKSLQSEGIAAKGLFVSLDTDRDTEKKLSDYFSAYPDTFETLRAGDDQLSDLKAAFGVEAIDINRIASNENYLIDHSTSSFLVRKNEELIALFDMFRGDLDSQEVAERLAAAIKVNMAE